MSLGSTVAGSMVRAYIIQTVLCISPFCLHSCVIRVHEVLLCILSKLYICLRKKRRTWRWRTYIFSFRRAVRFWTVRIFEGSATVVQCPARSIPYTPSYDLYTSSLLSCIGNVKLKLFRCLCNICFKPDNISDCLSARHWNRTKGNRRRCEPELRRSI